MANQERLICASAELADCGRGARFPLDRSTNGFVIRFLGRAHAFVNRCPHLGTELDWEPGEFFGGLPPTGTGSECSGLYLVCSTHGAVFEPDTGRCVAGPCRGASLELLQVREREGQVFLVEDGPPTNDESKSR